MTEYDTFGGVYPAMCTPFDDGSIDFETLRDDARRLEAAGVDGLVPMGSTGESATVSHDEHVEVVEAVADAVDEVPVVAGAGSNNTREAVSLSRRSAEVGADALLLISPYYNKPEQRGFIEHYETIADAVDVPQIIYNVPSRTGQAVPVDATVELATHPNVQGYKAAGGDLNVVSELVERTREETFDVLSGNDGETLPILSVGGTGCISVAANVEPERMGDLVRSALDGDYDRARAVHHELGPLFRALFVETNPIPVTAAMEIRGHGSGRVRSPLTEATEETRQLLEDVLGALSEDAAEAR